MKKILIFTRPWEVRFHMGLAKSLSKELGLPVCFATFFDKAKYIIESEGDGKFDVAYLPKLLRTVDLSAWNEDYFISMDSKFQSLIGANFNLMLGAERFLPKEQKKAEEFYRKHFLVLDKLIETDTLAISSFIDHYIYWLASALAWSKGGCYFAHSTIGMPPNYTVFYKHPMDTWIKNISLENATNIYKEAIEKLNIPTMKRVDYAISTPRPGMFKRFGHTISEIKHEKTDKLYDSYFQFRAPIKSRVFGHFKNIFNALKPKASIDYDIKSLTELPSLYVYYPLHYEPEATILILSSYLRDQIETSRIIAQSLPVGVKLLVKDHPQMYLKRHLSYYERLKAIPNVYLCSPLIEGKELTKKCIGVVSLSGTATIEASILGKNNLCFGWPPFGTSLQYCNFSTKHHIMELYHIFSEWKDRPNINIDIQKWRDWCSRLCNISLVPKNNGFEYEIIYDNDKVSAVVKHIIACLKYEGII